MCIAICIYLEQSEQSKSITNEMRQDKLTHSHRTAIESREECKNEHGIELNLRWLIYQSQMENEHEHERENGKLFRSNLKYGNGNKNTKY